jgi:ATP phosphoribosyltransferase
MDILKVVIPKGRIYNNVAKLLSSAGFEIKADNNYSYRPATNNKETEIKIMKTQNIPTLLELGRHDVGFSGFDWIIETGSNVAEIIDLKFDPVKIVAAIPNELEVEKLRRRKIVVASEYENITRSFLEKEKFNYVFLRTFGATEVFPPEDADMIVDNISTGRTLAAHGLKVISTILKSSTRFIASKDALNDRWKRNKISELKTLFQSILDASEHVMLEMNIPSEKFDQIVKILPCMRSPTIAELYGGQGYAVKVAVKKRESIKLIPKLRELGATDILEYELRKVLV